eukprot:TRINITY_DN3192_c0_g1_i4.p1 TRINITY_DN3192_c0_g1~~TRINITY_DN3192_c0_g1_i4.p1  ORF type:complete len:123 (+),score=47.10 TRINITY_DN3192_c0_g1_i4:200-568(+)
MEDGPEESQLELAREQVQSLVLAVAAMGVHVRDSSEEGSEELEEVRAENDALRSSKEDWEMEREAMRQEMAMMKRLLQEVKDDQTKWLAERAALQDQCARQKQELDFAKTVLRSTLPTSPTT